MPSAPPKETAAEDIIAAGLLPATPCLSISLLVNQQQQCQILSSETLAAQNSADLMVKSPNCLNTLVVFFPLVSSCMLIFTETII